MNYLAHLYLSGNSEKVMVGNFIGDYVKGKNYQKYSPEIAKGILLHRKIDSFTDNHSLQKEAKTIFKADFGLYSGIVMDLVYDHFLAKNWGQYSSASLRWFTRRAHAILLSNFYHLPFKVQQFLPFLIQNKRLESYAELDGIANTMRIMGNYSSFPKKHEIAREILVENYRELEENANDFLAEVIRFVDEELGQ